MNADIEYLKQNVMAGDRRALAKAITLIESQLARDRILADELLLALLPYIGGAKRLGISGPPGVGKSSLIEKLGPHLLKKGEKLAILAIDPTSPLSGGSILGDKTRMAELAAHPDVYIRPSPGGKGLGGIAARTREVMFLCEAAGFHWIIVETIGVGQSEFAVAEMTDMFMTLVSSAGGDELQGIKRGVMELADLFIVTKADGPMKEEAGRIKSHLDKSLAFLRPRREKWHPKTVSASIYEEKGIRNIAQHIDDFFQTQAAHLDGTRSAQNISWFQRALQEELLDLLMSRSDMSAQIKKLHAKLRDNQTLPAMEARNLIQKVLKNPSHH